MQAIVEERVHLEETDCSSLSRRGWRRAKQLGFSDAQLSYLMQVDESDIRSARLARELQQPLKQSIHVQQNSTQ